MKIKGLLLGMFACAALASCTNNDLVEGNEGGNNELTGDAYIAVTIANPSSSFGRAATAGNEEVGTASENTVNGATFVFFDASGNYVTNVKVAGSELELSESKQQSKTVLVLNNASVSPTSVVAFLNAPAGLNLNQSLTNLLAAAGEYGYAADGTFIMSNSSYKEGNEIQVATPLSGHVYTSKDEAMDNPLQIYVERVLAKVTVEDKLTTTPTETTLNGEKVTLKPVVTGWILNGTNKQSYVLKNITTGYGDWAWGTNRSFWAEDVNYDTSSLNDFTFKSYNNAVAANKETTEYCLENTLTYGQYTAATVAYTHLLVTARIQNATTEEYLGTFCSYNGAFYTEESLKNEFVSGLAGLNKNDGSAIVASDIKFVQDGTQGSEAYMAKPVFVNEDAVGDAAKTALTAKGRFMMYTEGKCYFWTAIEHFGADGETGSVGVVRNHIYKLTLNTISGLGTPIVDPEQPIIPEKPSDDNSYLAAQVNILSWKIVNQNVDLK